MSVASILLPTSLQAADETPSAGISAETEYVTSTFILEDDGVAPGGTIWLGFEQKVQEHWHVFWKNPGSAGLPLTFTWELPEGFSAGEIIFPTPEYIPVGPLASYAHEGSPIFLVPVTAPDNAAVGEDVSVSVGGFWQACADLCVPEFANFKFSIPVVETQTPRAETVSLFAAARDATPSAHEGKAQLTPSDGGYVLSIEDVPTALGDQPFFFPEQEGLTKPPGDQPVSRDGNIMRLGLEAGWNDELDVQTIRGVLVDNREHPNVAYWVDADLTATSVASGSNSDAGANANTAQSSAGDVTAGQPGFLLLLAMAMLGGVILNAMPCVFPILAVKGAHFARKSDDLSAIRIEGLVYAVGVLVSFMAMAGVLLALRAGGAQLGWGFHLQSPAVVGFSAYIMFLVGLNLSGVFNIGESVTGVGNGLTQKPGRAGAFFTGVLAVVVAAPCIGPFLTAPVGAALAGPPLQGLAVFMALAIGFAAPFTLISVVPALAKLLPKPGAWMELLKQVLAFPVYGAAAYFFWEFARQTDASALGTALGGAVVLGFAAWAFELSKKDGRFGLITRGVSALAFVGAFAAVISAKDAPMPSAGDTSPNYGALATQTFSEAALAEHHAAGKPVFVDFTAAWCVTCQFNKMTVLKTAQVTDVFKETGTTLMVADWTVRDPAITQALARFNASGVPLYVYYDKSGTPMLLPPTLTRGIVVDALRSGETS